MSDKDEIDWIKIHEPWRLKKVEEEITNPQKIIYTEKELYDLSKAEQIEIFKSHGIKDIPRYERERVEEIIKILKGGD